MSRIFLLLVLLTGGFSAIADTVSVNQWWESNSFPIPKPFFSNTKNVDNQSFADSDLLTYDHHELSWLKPGSEESMVKVRWEKRIDADTLILGETNTNLPAIRYVAFYIEVGRWMKSKLEISSPLMIRVWLDNAELGAKKKSEKGSQKWGNVSKELKLEPGKHRILVKILQMPGDSLEPKLRAEFTSADITLKGNLVASLSPQRTKNLFDILEGTKIRNVQLSMDGTYYTISFSHTPEGGKNVNSWTEIRRSADGKVVYRLDSKQASDLQWLPRSNRLSYLVKAGDNRILEILNVENLNTERLFTEDKNLSFYRWMPDETGVIFGITEENKEKYETTRRYEGMEDRQPGFKNRTYLYLFDLVKGSKHRLTYGNQTTNLEDISPDGQKIIVSVRFPDYRERPFSKQTVYMLDLERLTVDTLWKNKRWGLSIQFSPDGKQLLCSGGPSAFGKVGENIGKQKIANNYDTQLYIYDINSGKVDPITYSFNPSVAESFWSKVDKMIYLTATNKDTRTLYRYNVSNRTFTQLTSDDDYITAFNMAQNALVGVYQVSKINRYGIFYLRSFANDTMVDIESTDGENYRDVVFGMTKEWNFKSKSGKEITGRVYFPVDFDPSKKYPLIVYYYGGTTPVGRTFGGRYPFNLWAGAGYMVYVLQPSGAIGFGQEFSAAHVNNWGKTVADEIIEGTQKFLQAHPAADAKRVGCIGASYGGFMTMYLLTRTDLFAAAVSHAGISSISSYWGEGYWGYTYSSEASADSYPWNARDLYVNQSPLFNADKVKSPLLLLHGDSDTNVPPGESIQMYTALKILGVPVELVTVKNEDHHINGYQNRIDWHNSIMAWWAKYLKDQPEWWQDLYPEKNY
ncbi:MAG TPA: S9 family peptidase [Salinivirgaceae bacterium]|nr:S9 family peptidase [Salinivirgaceae bacterium]